MSLITQYTGTIFMTDIIEFTANNMPDSALAIPQRQYFLRVYASAVVSPDPNDPNSNLVVDWQKDKGEILQAFHKLQILQIIDDGKGGMILRCKVFI